ncbi:DUF1080 domain-containing protein [Nocardioides oleivorans]|uniref:DUF1080 domain-containing protein n=1 Tax=Nocardioides oleivorans TaxID=273676 RepID=A0A4Q2S0W9_9ACTN|nr:5'-nucleotidase C-terminal domain-containing protein [Nocardioides oleivorans]RYB94015.1 DUF1080 domain-containing protein [Nocardioides oleivorans]
MTQSVPTRWRRTLTALVSLAVGAGGVVAASPAPASAAPGDTMIAWLEVEKGAIAGNPGLDQGDHGNFSGESSYTFRDPGMRSTMSFTAPEAGTYPVWIRYSAGGLGNAADDNVTRKMGLLVNGGARQVLSYPATFVPGEADQHDGWERWSWTRTDVALTAGANTLALDCQRTADNGGDETCRLNFDAVQVGGTAPTGGTAAAGTTPAAPCTASTTIPAGATRLFDGTFASFDGTIAAPKWHKAGAGGYGFQTDCTLRGFRGQGTTWTTAQQSGPYTLGVDFLRGSATSASSVYVGSTSNGSASPTGGYQVRIGASDTGTIVTTEGNVSTAPDATALAAALKPQGQWNSLAVQVTPARIRLLLNGTVVNAVDRTAPMTGYVGLENRAGDTAAGNVRFRNIYSASGVVLGQSAPVRRATLANGTTVNRGAESTLGNLVADAQRWATRTAATGNAKLALVSPTRLNADLVAAGSGLTYAQAAAAVADEPVVTLRLTGAQIKAILEQQWQPAAATPGFLRLGASSGFTWTQDATRPAGDRITGMWLAGTEVPLTGTDNIVVAAAQSLVAGGDNFTGFAAGGPSTARTSTVAALAAYVGDRSASAPLAAPLAQAAVDVHVPDGAPSSYVAGTTYAVDLASWSYSGATDPKDATVEVSVGNRAIGTFPVDNTVTDDPTDLHGRVAVRATLPVDLPAGATTVRIVGTTTGTTVQRPIVVTAAPTNPTPNPTPDPTPDPTPSPTPNPAPQTGPVPVQPAPSKARPGIKVAVKPGKVVARRTRAKLAITVSAGGATPTGTVTVRLGKVRLEKRLIRGRATIWLPVFARPGTTRVSVSYGGDARTLTTTRSFQVRAVAP